MNALQQMLSVGFVLDSTGGGCTALVRAYPDGTEHVVTLVDQPRSPLADTDEVRVGLYHVDGGPPIADDFTDTFANVALEFLNSPVRVG